MIKSFFENEYIEYKENVSLKNYNTYRLETVADFLVFPKNVEQLIKIVDFAIKNSIKYLVLGNGSNVIFEKEKYNGIIIKLKYFNQILIDGNKVTAGAGVSLLDLSLETINNNLSGLEFANAIPGDVGASVCMNAGAYKEEMSDVVIEILVLDKDLNVRKIHHQELEYDYRHSILKNNNNYIALEATFQLRTKDKEQMLETIKNRIIRRRELQPLEYPSAGSVFRNPTGDYAGRLIEEANLKMTRCGGAEVSEKHANFIVNKDNAKGKDIVQLITLIQKEIKEKYNIDLEMEQIIIR